jgi:hypothetical protein
MNEKEPEYKTLDEVSGDPTEAMAMFDAIGEMVRLAHSQSDDDMARLVQVVNDACQADPPGTVAIVVMMACLIPPAEVEIGRRDFMKELFPGA